MALLLVWTSGQVAGQESAKPIDDADAVTIESVQTALAELEELETAGELDDEGRTRLQLYRGALESLRAAEQSVQLTTELAKKAAQAPVELEALRAELAAPPAEVEPGIPQGASPVELEKGLDTVEVEIGDARTRLAEIEQELDRRGERRTKIREDLAALQHDIDEIGAQMSALPLSEESAALTWARLSKSVADRRAAEAMVTLLKNELDDHDARSELLPLRRDRWNRALARLEKIEAAWQTAADEARAEDIRRTQEEATLVAARAHPAVVPIARKTLALAQKRDELQPRLDDARRELAGFVPDPAELKRQFARLREKTDVVGMTSTVGLLLRKDRMKLPDVRVRRNNIRAREALMADLEFDRLELEDDRDALITGKERLIERFMAGLAPEIPEAERAAIEQEVREQFRLRLEYLASLNADLTAYFDRLQLLNEKDQQVIDATGELIAFIDQHILWIRSADALDLNDLKQSGTALAWVADPAEWNRIGRRMWGKIDSHWHRVLITALLVLGLIVVRRRIGRRIGAIGGALAAPTEATLGQVMAVVVFTLLRAALFPIVLWSVGSWVLLGDVDGDNTVAAAVGTALQSMAVTLFILLLAFEACLPLGLGEAIFGWRPRNVRVARRNIGGLSLALVVFGFPVVIMSHQTNEAFESSLGRLGFIAAVIALALAVHGVLNPRTGILRDFLARNPESWANRLRYIWYPAAVLIPLTIAMASGLGWHYTALRICGEVLDSTVFLIVIVLLHYLALRWIVMGQRKLALEQARKRQAASEERAARGEPAGGAPQAVAGAQFDVSEVSGQAMQLLRIGTLFSILIGLFLIWSDSLPAISFLDRVVLWQGTDGMINVQDLVWAMVLVVGTFIVARNIPGLLEITVLQHLPLERGSQFAISTIIRYTLTIVGVAVALGVIGITWAKVQWLAAALTVGLGFGLNEIFGNFISGLIILFEQPIRVGDTVTVGQITGTVSRIRIRSTTIVDWDRKELVIPNKTFVTDTITNWTLSDAILRLVFPVTIAHDSDTALAEKLLLQVAQGHGNVLSNPAPSVMFKKVGENGLEIDLRLFIPHIDHFVKVRHEIHKAIVAAFREAGVRFFEFSHRDVEVRAVGGVSAAALQPSLAK